MADANTTEERETAIAEALARLLAAAWKKRRERQAAAIDRREPMSA